ncbi:MAG: tetratricopeptide repeat protein [Cardiobacteriaceae bacterium]|nr:tetratricopeptide repeat protein [Cardiobacteriaceae bacterium]
MHPDYQDLSDRAEQAFLQGQLDFTLTLRREALSFASIYCAEDSVEYVHALHGLASILIDHHQFHEAESHLNTALSLLGERAEGIEALLMMSEIRLHQGKLQSALDLLHKAKSWIEQFLPSYEASFLTIELERNWAWYYEAREDFETALQHYQSALELSLQEDDDALLLPIYSELGLCEMKLERLEEALHHLSLALELAQKRFDAPHPEIANSHYDMAQIYLELQQFDHAKEHIQSALRMNEAVFTLPHMVVARDYALYGEVCFECEELEQAEQMLQQSLSILETCHPDGCLEMAQVFELLSDVYEETDRLEQAQTLRDYAEALYKRFDADRDSSL